MSGSSPAALDVFSRFPRPRSLGARLRRVGWMASLFLDMGMRGRKRGARGSLRGRLRVLRQVLAELPAAYRRETLRFL
jgi:hypothetical protein